MSRNICLAGMMGSGKSTVARHIAARLGRRAVDTDHEIVRWRGQDVPTLFAVHGEEGFRDLETTVVGRLADCQDLVIALGGGAILRDENVEALRLSSVIVLLDVPVDELVRRVAGEAGGRPLLTGPSPSASHSDEVGDRLERTHRARAGRYADAADVVIDGVGTVDEVAERIVDWACAQGDVLTPSEHEQVMR